MKIPSVEILTSYYSVHVCGSYLIRCRRKLLSNSNYLIYISIVFPFSSCHVPEYFSHLVWAYLFALQFPFYFSTSNIFFLHDLSLKICAIDGREKLSLSIFVREMACGSKTRREERKKFDFMHANVCKISHDKFTFILFSIVQIKWNIYVLEEMKNRLWMENIEWTKIKVFFFHQLEKSFSSEKLSACNITITIFCVKSMLVGIEADNRIAA